MSDTAPIHSLSTNPEHADHQFGSILSTPAVYPEVRDVVVGFKTHLDIGFTDLAERVVEKYLNELIPSVLDTIEALGRTHEPFAFVWSAGSWLIDTALNPKTGMSAGNRRRLEAAIHDGHVAWHALPFTTHSELMDRGLFEAGLDIFRRLDHAFAKTTRAAKMTDVPGHTRGVVAPLADAGIELLHLGVNPGSAVPDVPDRFRWINSGGQSLVVVYEPEYARVVVTADGERAFVLVHAGDNHPAPNPQELKHISADLRRVFPRCRLRGGTLNNLADMLRNDSSGYPEITHEIGDSWLHGAASDPPKLSRLRALLRYRRTLLDEGVCVKALRDFDEALLLSVEHTWGLDEKTYLADNTHYLPEDFAQVRASGSADNAKRRSFTTFEASWQEQRRYLDNAVEALPGVLRPDEIDPGLQKPHNPEILPADLLADRGLKLIIRYQVFDHRDFATYFAHYNRNRHQRWVYEDFTKPGLEHFGEYAATWDLEPTKAWCTLSFPVGDHPAAQPPRRVAFGLNREIALPAGNHLDHLHLDFQDKPANRWPEALWVGLIPVHSGKVSLSTDKLGERIELDHVANKAARLHAAGETIDMIQGDRRWNTEPIDTPIFTDHPSRLLDPRPLSLNHGINPLGLWFNIYNNVWGTNFPMWMGGNWTARFNLRSAEVTPRQC